ncbi:MAG TPA: response regulator transcription factor [Solirubrobacteraceae bacterium]|jgi:DNA-binding NarL/FixJ family response regulator|nr:response regulator transcription factor [Solirubrobacteraceae bacterium]
MTAPDGVPAGVPPVRVLLADDQRLVRESLATLLGLLGGIELVGSASDGEEAVALAVAHEPDVVLMDLRMPRMDGIAATRALRDRLPGARVIALTTFADDESVLGALRAGARGYLTKDAGAEDIKAAILTVAAGEATLDPAVQHHVVAALAAGASGGGSGGGSGGSGAAGGGASGGSGADGSGRGGGACDEAELPDGLTPREAEVLGLIADGLSNAEIAERLFVSPTTVKSHINHLFAKAGLRDRAQAVAYAYRVGVAAPPE